MEYGQKIGDNLIFFLGVLITRNSNSSDRDSQIFTKPLVRAILLAVSFYSKPYEWVLRETLMIQPTQYGAVSPRLTPVVFG